MAKFMVAVGDPLTASSLHAGYEAGVVTEDELETINAKFPGVKVSSTNLPEVQSRETIEAHWRASLEGQPWHVYSMGNLATATIVPLVAKMQEKAVKQASAMKWINENALPMIQENSKVVGLLSDSNEGTTKLAFNNTRAKYEDDRGVWSASMDVFAVNHDRALSSEANGHHAENEIGEEPVSEARAALQALKDGTGDDDEDDLSSFLGSIDVLEQQQSGSQNDDAIPLTTTPTTLSNSPGVVGLVNAYFVPDDEIKILVVEIDGILHNVTWKGLD